ncbi:hypothetical protein [Sporomusa aerivorans]|uniref:hypothetical protein n=1 Tax=Sporomusa aerivorans TaxID=204936 RepID=UPI00352A786C
MDVQQAIDLLRNRDITIRSADEIASLLEAQTREAELGRKFNETVQAAKSKRNNFAPSICINLPPEINEKWCSSCFWIEFCRLRAEMQRKGAE